MCFFIILSVERESSYRSHMLREAHLLNPNPEERKRLHTKISRIPRGRVLSMETRDIQSVSSIESPCRAWSSSLLTKNSIVQSRGVPVLPICPFIPKMKSIQSEGRSPSTPTVVVNQRTHESSTDTPGRHEGRPVGPPHELRHYRTKKIVG